MIYGSIFLRGSSDSLKHRKSRIYKYPGWFSSGSAPNQARLTVELSNAIAIHMRPDLFATANSLMHHFIFFVDVKGLIAFHHGCFAIGEAVSEIVLRVNNRFATGIHVTPLIV